MVWAADRDPMLACVMRGTGILAPISDLQRQPQLSYGSPWLDPIARQGPRCSQAPRTRRFWDLVQKLEGPARELEVTP